MTERSALQTAREVVGELQGLLKLREVRVVTMHHGATDHELQTAVLELGAIRPPEPEQEPEPTRRTRRRRAAA